MAQMGRYFVLIALGEVFLRACRPRHPKDVTHRYVVLSLIRF